MKNRRDIPGLGTSAKTWKAQKGVSVRTERSKRRSGLRWSWSNPTGPVVLGSMGIWGFCFNVNEKLLKSFNEGSDMFLFLKITSCYAKQQT